MLRSMDSAISGMQAFQTQLDVIGNNIANVDTTGFKSGRVDFSDLLSQTASGGSTPAATPTTPGLGGTNPQQVGLGVKIASIDTIFTQGADQTTSNPLDLALNGSGMFVASPGNSTSGTPQLFYTRNGTFSLDSGNNLVLPNGMVAMGIQGSSSSASFANSNAGFTQVNLTAWASKASPAVTLSSAPNLQIGQDGSVNVTDNTGARRILGYLAMATFPNPAGLSKVGDSMFQASSNSGFPSTPGTATTGSATSSYYQTPGLNNSASIQSGALEMSNVDLTNEFSQMITAQQGFGANSKVINTDNNVLADILSLRNN